MATHQESPKRPHSLTRFAAAAAIAVGLGVGSYGIASAASGSGTTSTPTATNSAPAAPPGASGGATWVTNAATRRCSRVTRSPR